MRIWQPVVQRRQPDLGAVAHQQEHEREREHRRFELTLDGGELSPQQCAHAFRAEHLLGREVQQDRAEQRLRDPDAAEDEILPAGFEACGRAIQRHEQHGGQRRGFHRDPEQAQVVARERDQHHGHEQLVHAVVQPQAPRIEPPVLDFHAHVGAGENRRGEADECGECDQEHVERVDEELVAAREQVAFADHAHRERRRRKERDQAQRDVDLGGASAMAPQREQHRPAERRREQDHEFHYWSSFSDSRWCRSRLSNCSRIWKKNTPSTSIATSTSSATPSSTTIGMP